MPNNPLWALMLLLSTISLLLVAYANFRRRQVFKDVPTDPAALAEWAERKLMPKGAVDGTATVVNFTPRGFTRRGFPMFDVELAIAIPGRAPYTVRKPGVARPNDISKVQAGMSFPVRVDVTNATNVLMRFAQFSESGPTAS